MTDQEVIEALEQIREGAQKLNTLCSNNASCETCPLNGTPSDICDYLVMDDLTKSIEILKEVDKQCPADIRTPGSGRHISG